MKFTRIAAVTLMATSLTSGIVLAETRTMAVEKTTMEKTTMEKPALIPAQDFVKKATIGNTFEIESSQLALQRTKNADVKVFAQRMITDHTKAGEDMKAALKNANAKPEPMKLDTLHQGLLTSLQEAPAAQFDAKYMEAQMGAHNETVALFKGYADEGMDPALKDFAKNTLPTLEDHKKHVADLQDKMSK